MNRRIHTTQNTNEPNGRLEEDYQVCYMYTTFILTF